MEKIPQERVDLINKKWMEQDKDALPPHIKQMFSEFSEKVWRGTPRRNRGAVLKLEKKIALRKLEETILDFETLKNKVEHGKINVD